MEELAAIKSLAARLQEGGPGSGRHPAVKTLNKLGWKTEHHDPQTGKTIMRKKAWPDTGHAAVVDPASNSVHFAQHGKTVAKGPLEHVEQIHARLYKTTEGGPGSGRHPGFGKNAPPVPAPAPTPKPRAIRGGKTKMLIPGGVMKVSDITYHIADPKKGTAMCGRGGKGGGPSQNTVVVPGGAKPTPENLDRVKCPRCLAKYTARNYRATETSDKHGIVAAVEHRPDYGTFVIPPIDPDQKHARESFVALIERKTEEYGTSDGAKKGWDTRGRATKGDKLDRTIANIKQQIADVKQGKPSTSIAQKPGAPSVRDVASYWSATKHGGMLNAPKFTGQSKIGMSHLNKMNVMSRAQGQSIFSKAGKAKGFK